MRKIIKNVKQFIGKYDELFFIIIFLIMISGFALNIKTIAYDEMWNFQNIYKMYNGYKIYIDANVITTPIFHYIGLILFKILGANFLVFKLYNILIFLFLFFVTYKFLKQIGVNKNSSLFLVLIIFIVERDIIYACANYNILVILFVLSSFIIILNREHIKFHNFYESIFITLIILTKQNIGIFYIIGYIIFNLIYYRNKKDNIKVFLCTFIFLIIYIFFMFKNGILNGFISYCFLGITDFAKYNNYISILDMTFFTIVVFINIYVIIYINFLNKNKIMKKQRKVLNLLSCFGFPILLMAYPIFNTVHIKISLYIHIIMILYYFYITLLKNGMICRKIIIILCTFIIIIYSEFSIKNIYSYYVYISLDRYNYENVYFGTLFDKELKNKIDKITEFIVKENYNVIVLSSEAALYEIPLKISNGAMDLPLMGNFGKDGEDGIIYQLSMLENKKILIRKEKNCVQESDNIINYVKNNFISIGEIEDFIIYENK